jgi:hypothetical protein
MKIFNLASKTLMFCCALAAMSGVAVAQIVTDIGPNPPTPGATDISSIQTPDTGYGVDEKPGGMNYYDDNGNGLVSPGQTFLSPTNGVLTSVAYQMGNNNGTYSGGLSGTGPGLMKLRVFQLAGPGSTTATKLAEYSSDPNFTFTASDWLQWTGIAVRLTNGVNYAYTISSGVNNNNGSQMYCRVYCVTNQPYPDGSICLIQAAGGPNSVTYNAVADFYDQNFDLGFSDLSVLDKPLAPAPSVSPATTVYGGTRLTLAEDASGGNLHYQWQIETDGGSATLTNIPGAAASNLVQVAAYNGNPAFFDVVVTNANGAVTSPVVQVTINPPSAPVLLQDLDPLNPSTFVGGSLTFNAEFDGTLPISYQWMTNSGGGYHPIPAATNTTLTLKNLQFGSVGSIELVATNSIGTNNSSAAIVTVLAAPPAPTPDQPYAYAVYENNPLVYWRFSETNDTTVGGVPAYDYSGHGYDASYGSNVLDNVAGPQPPAFPGFETSNTGVQLPGPNVAGGHGYLVSPDLNVDTNTVTIAAWLNPNANVVTTVGLVFWRNSAGDAAGLDFGGAASTNGMHELGYTWNNNSSLTWNWDSNLFPPLNQWSFVALTITPSNATMYLYYVDPNAMTTNLLTAVNVLPHTAEAFSGGIIRIGDDTFDDYRTFPGFLDEVAVFTHPLSESQVKSLFFTALGVPSAVTLAHSWNGQQLTLSWPQGTLMEATNLPGPWATNTAASPFVVTPTGPRKFYRVQVR